MYIGGNTNIRNENPPQKTTNAKKLGKKEEIRHIFIIDFYADTSIFRFRLHYM